MASLIRFVALCLLLSVVAEVATAQTCDPVDSSALQYFCREIPYARTEFKTWIEGTNCCDWEGVICDGSGHVENLTIVNIDSNPPNPGGPSYSLGTALTGLNYLKSLVIKNVAFNGAIPASWGTMSTLTVLSVESCNIAGALPEEICKLTGLRTFSVYENLFTGPLPACFATPTTTFPGIQYFNISQNNWS